MGPYELLEPTGPTGWYDPEGATGISWLQRLAAHYPRSAWLNPEPPKFWSEPTINLVRRVFPMYPLTLDGLTEAVGQLTHARGAR